MAGMTLYISVCDQTISVCRAAQKGKGVHIFESFIFQTPEDSVSDGIILNPELLGEALRAQLIEHGVASTKDVVFSLLSNRIAIREIKLPPMKKKLMATAIATNSQDYFPIDLKSYHITYNLLEAATTEKPYNRLLALAVPLSIIDSYFALADKAGLKLKAIDSSGNSQYQAIKQLALEGITVFVDTGCSSSVVTFISEGKLLLQRTFAFGTFELLTHYAVQSGKPRENMLEVLNETDMTHPDFAADKLLTLPDVQADLERLVGGVMRSIDYFNSSQSTGSASRIVLLGLSRHTIGLQALIAESTGLETLYLENIPDFMQIVDNYAEAPSFVNCIGGAFELLNLIPNNYKPAKDGVAAKTASGNILPGVILCGLILVTAIVVSGASFLKYNAAKETLADTQSEIASLQSAQETYDTYVLYQEGQTALNSFSAGTRTINAQLVSFFEELEKKMPSSILLLTAACTSEGVSLGVTVGSYTDAAAVISALRSFESLQKVEISELTRTEDEAGAGRVSFSVNCLYGANPYTGNTNPYEEVFVVPDETSATDANQSQEAGQ